LLKGDKILTTTGYKFNALQLLQPATTLLFFTIQQCVDVELSFFMIAIGCMFRFYKTVFSIAKLRADSHLNREAKRGLTERFQRDKEMVYCFKNNLFQFFKSHNLKLHYEKKKRI
jgi:hypothetical protein